MNFKEYLNEAAKKADNEMIDMVKEKITSLGYKFKQSKKGPWVIFNIDEIYKNDENIYPGEIKINAKTIEMAIAKHSLPDNKLQGYQNASQSPYSQLTLDNLAKELVSIEKFINKTIKDIQRFE